MIKTGKKDIIISYAAYFLRLASNVFLLPIILNKMPTDEYGLWNVFLAVGAIVILIDFGFSTVIVRYITYAYCGAENIPETGMPKIKNGGVPNYPLLFKVFFTGKRVYKKLFFISIAIAGIMSIYLLYVGKEVGYLKTILSWAIYGFSICMYIYYISYNCIIKGLGKLKESNMFYIIQQMIYLSFASILLSLELGILAMAIANFIANFVFRSLNIKFIYRLFEPQRELFHKIEKEKPEDYLFQAIRNNTKGLALVTISNYISSYGGTLICSTFLPLNQIASYGLTNQLVGIISSIATAPFSIFMPKLSDMQLNDKKEQLKEYYAGISAFMTIIYLLGGITLISAGNWILKLLKTKTLLLKGSWILILLIYNYVSSNHQRCTNFIMLNNRQPHIRAYWISSMATLLFSFVGLIITRDLSVYLLTALTIQLCYNAWKWPLELKKQLEMNSFEKWSLAYKSIKNIRKGEADK